MGAVIGAGFASGQEILQFYISFGVYGIYGIILSSVLFAYLGALVLYLSGKLRTSGYRKLFNYLLGKKLGKFVDVISLLILAGGLVIMLAGSGAVFSENLGVSKYAGSFLVAVFICIVIYCGLQGLLTVNAWLVPVKLIVILLVCLYSLKYNGILLPADSHFTGTERIAGNWVWSAILYVSYNMIIPVAVLSSLGASIKTGKGIISGVIGGLGLGLTAAVITLSGFAFYPGLADYQVPLLFMAGNINYGIQKILALLIWLAIVTTAIANAHGFASRLAPPNSKNYKIAGIGLVIIALPFSGMEFTQLIKKIYPIFGYAGLIMLGALLFTPLYKKLTGRH